MEYLTKNQNPKKNTILHEDIMVSLKQNIL